MADHGVSLKEPQAQRSYLHGCIQWLRMKRYQFEVMLPLYMLTRNEVIVFYLISAMLISMFLVAAYFYLPNHVSIISNRVYYYVMGELNYMSSTVTGTASGLSQLVRKTPVVSGDSVAYTAMHTAANAIRQGKEL